MKSKRLDKWVDFDRDLSTPPTPCSCLHASVILASHNSHSGTYLLLSVGSIFFPVCDRAGETQPPTLRPLDRAIP